MPAIVVTPLGRLCVMQHVAFVHQNRRHPGIYAGRSSRSFVKTTTITNASVCAIRSAAKCRPRVVVVSAVSRRRFIRERCHMRNRCTHPNLRSAYIARARQFAPAVPISLTDYIMNTYDRFEPSVGYLTVVSFIAYALFAARRIATQTCATVTKRMQSACVTSHFANVQTRRPKRNEQARFC